MSVAGKTAYKYPEAATFLLTQLNPVEYGILSPDTVIDAQLDGVSKEQKERIDAIFNALACEIAPFAKVFPLLQRHAEAFIEDETFRNSLYAYLQDTPDDFAEKLLDMKIIPVYGETGGSKYVSWVDDGIFVKRDAKISDKSYWVLNETLLPKAMCEKMLGVNINEINAEWERSRYNERLNRIVHGSDVVKIYQHLITEFRTGALQRNDSFATLYAVSETIPLKNELGEIVDTNLFLCDLPTGYFQVHMIQRLIIHKECEEFAKYMRYRDLRWIHYEDIDYYEELTADDVEAILDQSGYFANAEEILRGFYKNGLLSDDLIREYGLEYLSIAHPLDDGESYAFPNEPVGDISQLSSHIKKQWAFPLEIISVDEVRSIRKVKNRDGSTSNLDYNYAREGTLKTYTPFGAYRICFCQMCLKSRPYYLIEVNNIELLSKYYFPQMRIALCLDCSKNFEYLRANSNIRNAFIDSILQTSVGDQGTVSIPLGNEHTITFTAKHLAEIQEIIRQMPKN